MRHVRALAISIAVLSLAATNGRAQQVTVTLDPAVATAATTGRLFVIFGRTDAREPRSQAGSYGGSVPFYGTDVDAWKPGTATTVGAHVLGFPFDDLAHMPAGDYYAQALLNVYTQFHRADGHVDLGARRSVGRAALVIRRRATSSAKSSRCTSIPSAHTVVKLTLDQEAAAGRSAGGYALGEAREDEERAAVEVLGRAGVRRRDRASAQGLQRVVDDDAIPRSTAKATSDSARRSGSPIRAEPSTVAAAEAVADAAPAERVGSDADERAREWFRLLAKRGRATDFPRFVAITWQHPTPYYDDSYAVNSVNNGPYQDALLKELVPRARASVPSDPGSECAFSHRRIDRRLGMRRAPDPAP